MQWFMDDFKFAIIINDLGIEMGMYRGMNVYLAMNQVYYQGKVQGMCGNMDFEKIGEFQTPELKVVRNANLFALTWICLLYTSPSPRDATLSRMPSSA